MLHSSRSIETGYLSSGCKLLWCYTSISCVVVYYQHQLVLVLFQESSVVCSIFVVWSCVVLLYSCSNVNQLSTQLCAIDVTCGVLVGSNDVIHRCDL